MYEVNESNYKYTAAALCGLGARVHAMRIVFKNSPPEIQRVLAPFIGPIAFEKELLSGNLERHTNGAIELGKTYDFGRAQAEAEAMQAEAEMQIAEMLSHRAIEKLKNAQKKFELAQQKIDSKR